MAVNPDVLLRRRRQVLDSLRSITAQRASSAWASIKAPDTDGAHAIFARRARPAIRAGQQRAAFLTIAYLRRLTGLDPEGSIAELLDNAVDLEEPFIAFGRAVNAKRFAEAFEAGRLRAGSIAFDGVTSASRLAAGAFDRQITGWQRVPSGNACQFCADAAGQTYTTAASADFGHERCGCVVEPVT